MAKSLDQIYSEAYFKHFNVFKDNWEEVAIIAMKEVHNQAVDLCNEALETKNFDALKIQSIIISQDSEPPF